MPACAHIGTHKLNHKVANHRDLSLTNILTLIQHLPLTSPTLKMRHNIFCNYFVFGLLKQSTVISGEN